MFFGFRHSSRGGNLSFIHEYSAFDCDFGPKAQPFCQPGLKRSGGPGQRTRLIAQDQRSGRSHCAEFPYGHCIGSFINGMHSTTESGGTNTRTTGPSVRHHKYDGTPDLARRFAVGQAMGTIGPFGPETICILDRQCNLRINDRAGIQYCAVDSCLRGNGRQIRGGLKTGTSSLRVPLQGCLSRF